MYHKKHGWTNQESKCSNAVWWDCSFLCTNKKVNPNNDLIPCPLTCPDILKCPKKEVKNV